MTTERRPTPAEYAEYCMALVMQYLPVSWTSALGGFIGAKRGRQAITKQRLWVRRMHDNLKRFKQIEDPTERERRIVEYTRQVGRIYSEFTVLHRLVRDGRVELVGEEHLASISRPVILVGAHLSNWELIGHVLAKLGPPAASLYAPPDNPLRHRLALKARRGWVEGGELIPASSSAMSRLQKALLRGANQLLFVDEERDGYIWAPGLGRQISYAGNRWFAARLAARHQVDLLPVHVETLGPARYRIVIEPKLNPEGDTDAIRARSLADQMDRMLDRWIRARPEEWYWLAYFEYAKPGPGTVSATS